MFIDIYAFILCIREVTAAELMSKMSNDGKKISFSFSKVKKQNLINKPKVEATEKIDYVDCFDGSKGKFSYKGNVRSNEDDKQELVIPMPSTKTSLDILRSRIEEKLNNAKEKSNELDSSDKTFSETLVSQNSFKNLEELAALEILSETKSSSIDDKKANGLVIISEEVIETSEANIDYDNVPVSDFGMALLRGMGWKPGAGIGKEPRLVSKYSPKLRPKGLGLGAKLNLEVDEEKVKEKEKKKN